MSQGPPPDCAQGRQALTFNPISTYWPTLF